MHQLQTILRPVAQLSQIFPDIEGELCSRHSTLFGKLKQTFNKLYDKLDPSHYVIVKGDTQIAGGDQVSLSMALQNGIILLVKKTFDLSNVYLNGNHIDQQVIFGHTGKLVEGLHEWSDEISTTFQTAIEDIPRDRLSGGIIYIHANIPEGTFSYKKAMLIAFFLGILMINGQLSNYCIEDLIKKISSTGVIAEQAGLQKYFYDYQNRKLALTVKDSTFAIPLDPNIKLIFCQLDLGEVDRAHHAQQKQFYAGKKKQILNWLQLKSGVKSFYEAFQEQVQVSVEDMPGNKQEAEQLIKLQMKQLSALCEFSNKQMSFEELLELKWEIDYTHKRLYSPEVAELVQSLKQKMKVQACGVVQGEFLVIPVDKRKFTEIICLLRQLLHKGQLKSKSVFKIDEEIVENRWGQDNSIGQKIFASSPSHGIAIFDPQEAIWFD